MISAKVAIYVIATEYQNLSHQAISCICAHQRNVRRNLPPRLANPPPPPGGDAVVLLWFSNLAVWSWKLGVCHNPATLTWSAHAGVCFSSCDI